MYHLYTPRHFAQQSMSCVRQQGLHRYVYVCVYIYTHRYTRRCICIVTHTHKKTGADHESEYFTSGVYRGG